MPYGVDVSIQYPSSAPAGRIVAIDCGPTGKFAGIKARGVTVQRGQTVKIRRSSRNSWSVISPSSPTARTSGFAARTRRIMIIGQSLGQQWEYMPAAGAFLDQMGVLSDAANTSFIHCCTGGSAALKECRPDANRWWYDPTPGSYTAGPMYYAAQDLIDSIPSSERPNAILWIQGEQDSGVYAGTTDEEDTAFRIRYESAVYKVLDLLRARINPTNRYVIPAFIQILGRRASGERRGMPIVREAQHNVIALAGKNIGIAATPPEDLPLADDVHPNADGYQILGTLTADALSPIL